MAKPLEVTPEHLHAASAGLTAAQTAASTGIATASATLFPALAGADDVSTFASAAFGGYAATSFLPAVSVGLLNHLAGAQVLAPVAADYQATDANGGVAISAHSVDYA